MGIDTRGFLSPPSVTRPAVGHGEDGGGMKDEDIEKSQKTKHEECTWFN